jgi:hypothetical protein
LWHMYTLNFLFCEVFVSNQRGKFHAPTPNCNFHVHGLTQWSRLSVTQLQTVPPRPRVHYPFCNFRRCCQIGHIDRWAVLFTVFIIYRYSWNEFGFFSFLTSDEQRQVAMVTWASWDEYADRESDNLFNLSPLAGNSPNHVTLQTA